MSGVKDLRRAITRYRQVGWALALSSFVSVGFYLVGALNNHSGEYWYLVWNLFLAWLPLVFAVWLAVIVPRRGWSSGVGVLLTLLWLGFLPNSFYIASDFIHLGNIVRSDVLYDAVMFLSFVFNGLVLGFISLYIVHKLLLTRLTARVAHVVVTFILLLCSFAIYLGRDLRWNTWDVLVNPAGILFDISDRFINPRAHPRTFTTTLTFFVLLSSIYIVIWQLAQINRHEGPS